MRVLLLFGGRSAEHDVSVVSVEFVRDVMRETGQETVMIGIGTDGSWTLGEEVLSIRTGRPRWTLLGGKGEIPFDLVFPVLHGPFGEDGTVQGLCMMAGWPFAGAGVMTSSVAMNKVTTKELAAAHGIPVVPWKAFMRRDPPDATSVEEIGYPLFVKPARMGSSVGVSRVESSGALEKAVELAFRYDNLILVEKGIESAREIEVALLSEDGLVSSSVPGEIEPGLEWYDYTAKYDCAESRLLIPAPISDTLGSTVRRYAERCFSILGGSGFARADFLLDGDGSVYFNEINTIPGFTGISMFPKLWEATGVSSAEVIERIVREALRRHAESCRNSTEVSS
ncbi:MAG: D-alanine--D-alanine ligase [Candidatus Fermentibacteraceae bacterium]|nr:D-alanine--D-alanine ligase [Candidatus Fermentibacteraceae bacterium]MBN2607668.1 D-alanine--D-alanine ligase [Candidatus Fermentibacteraceae bacterium]